MSQPSDRSGPILRCLRQLRGLSEEELVEGLGFDVETLRRMESSEETVGVIDLRQLLRRLGLNLQLFSMAVDSADRLMERLDDERAVGEVFEWIAEIWGRGEGDWLFAASRTPATDPLPESPAVTGRASA